MFRIFELQVRLPFLSFFDLSRKTRNSKPFIAINDKKTIKILHYKILKIALKFFKFFTGKILVMYFLLFLKIFGQFSKWKSYIFFGTLKIIKKGSNLAKIRPKMKKIDLSFIDPYLSPINDKWKKSDKR